MFDASFPEMLLVGVIALLVIGPERLPGLASKLGRFVGKARAFIATTRSDIERELHAEELRGILSKQEQEIRELRNIMQNKTDEVRQGIRDTEQLIDTSTREAVQQAASKTPPAASASAPPLEAAPSPHSPELPDNKP